MMEFEFYDGVFDGGYVYGPDEPVYVGKHTPFIEGEIWFRVMPENAYVSKHQAVEKPVEEMEIPEIDLYAMHNAEKSARYIRRAEARKHKPEEMPKARKEQAYMRNQNACRKVSHWGNWKHQAIRQERAISRDQSALHDFRDEMAEDMRLAEMIAKKAKYEDLLAEHEEAVKFIRANFSAEVRTLLFDEQAYYDALFIVDELNDMIKEG